MTQFDIHHLSNGMTVLGEQLENVESASFGIMLPAGASLMPQGYCGAGNVISDWSFRGAGERTSKQLVDALDHLGLQRNVSVGSSHFMIGASLECENLAAALSLYADVTLRPSLTDDQFEATRELAVERKA